MKNSSAAEGNWFVDLLMSLAPDPNKIEVTGTPGEMSCTAAKKAAAISAGANLPPGPFSLLTVIPELVAVSKVQIDLIYRIAKYYKKQRFVNKTIVLLIMANAFGLTLGRAFVRTAGKRVIIKVLGSRVLMQFAKRVGIQISTRVIAKLPVRIIPGLAAVVFACLSYSMTKKIGEKADELLSQDINLEDAAQCSKGHEVPPEAKFCPDCGEKMNGSILCSKGHPVDIGVHFCPECGENVQKAA
jgi:hypothetical protein